MELAFRNRLLSRGEFPQFSGATSHADVTSIKGTSTTLTKDAKLWEKVQLIKRELTDLFLSSQDILGFEPHSPSPVEILLFDDAYYPLRLHEH